MPPLSCGAVQLKVIEVAVVAVRLRLFGAVGTVLANI